MKRTVTKNNKQTTIIIASVLLAILIIIGAYFVLGKQNTTAGEETMKNENIVTISTNKGDIIVELYEQEAPITVENFKQYVKEDFYNNTIFHRVIKDFMIQGGGFTADGVQKQTRPAIKLEADISNTRGTIAMARTNVPDSATSQFFINHADNAFLNPAPGNPGYAVFGEVISGLDVVDTIAQVQTKNSPTKDWPVEDIIITSITFGGEANV